MSNRTYACFECRTTGRVPSSRITMDCRKCRKPAHHIYYKFKIPGRRDERGWAELERRVRPMNLEFQTGALRRVRAEQARIRRVIETLPESRRARRLDLNRRLERLAKEHDDWLKWSVVVS